MPAESPQPMAAQASGASGGTDASFDLRLIWSTIRHCWFWAAPLGIAIGSAAAFSVYVSFVPQYEASHTLEANQDYIVFENVLAESSNLEATERQIILSDAVLDDVVAKANVQAAGFTDLDASVEQIRNSLKVATVGTQTLLRISYTHPDPVVAALVCNEVAGSFLEQRELLDNRRVGDVESWLTPSIDIWKAEVQGHERRIVELSKASMGFDPSNPIESMEFDLSTLSDLRGQLQELQIKEAWLETNLRNRTTDESTTAPEEIELLIPEPTSAEINSYVENTPEVARQRSLRAENLEVLKNLDTNGLKSLRQDYYQKIQEKVTAAEAGLESAREKARQEAVEKIRSDLREVAERAQLLASREAIANSKKTLAQKKTELAELKARRALLEVEYENEKGRLERKGGNAMELMFAKEDRAIASGILGMMQQRLAAIKIERRRGSGLNSVDVAKPPRSPVVPLPYKNMTLAGLLGLAFPFGLGLFLEMRAKRISDVAVLDTPNLAAFGEVAKLPTKVGQSKRQRVFEESIDTLRANLMLSKQTKNARTVTIASSMSGEGKSSVSSQLAISLAKACGETVLLVDADLRSPDQHDIFGIDMGAGLAGVMAKEVELNAAINDTLGELVHVLPAGHMSQSPHRLLSADGMRALLDTALEKYKYVVVDTAPVLAAGETLAIASQTDATLVCVMRDVSRSDAVLRTSRRLEAAGANVVGTVFSGVPARQYAYRYGDYRYLAPKIQA
ncbi:MAG: polysaccharide biosynthesis tyrosine autokinase [Rubripirellula sp.]